MTILAGPSPLALKSPARAARYVAAHQPDQVVKLQGISKRFGDQVILDDVALTIGRGEFVALLGASGSGKTTLLRILAGLDQANQGEALVTPERSVVFQEHRLLPFRRAWRNVVLGLNRRHATRARAEVALAEVGLAAKANSWPRHLSGGESQRVALARALVRAPGLLLLDEPFAALDALTRINMHNLVETLWREHRPGVLIVTHDVDEALYLADRILVLKEGRFAVEIALPPHLIRNRAAQEQAAAEVLALKRRLLAELGVVQPDQNHPTHAAAPQRAAG